MKREYRAEGFDSRHTDSGCFTDVISSPQYGLKKEIIKKML